MQEIVNIAASNSVLLSAFTHPHVVPNLWNMKEDILKNGIGTFLNSFLFKILVFKVNFIHFIYIYKITMS